MIVGVDVLVGVFVGVLVGVTVLVGVFVGVGVGVEQGSSLIQSVQLLKVLPFQVTFIVPVNNRTTS